MLRHLFELLGWLGIAAFFARFLLQWIASERAGRSLTPASFWWLSIAGSVALAAYSAWRGELVLLAGLFVNGAIYARNLGLARAGGARSVPERPRAVLAGVAAIVLLAGALVQARDSGAEGAAWRACVLAGQAAWSSRFVVQWWIAESGRPGSLTASFWWLSLGGNVLLLVYAIHLGDPVYVAGFALGPLVQVRNLVLGSTRSQVSPRRRRDELDRGGEPAPPAPHPASMRP